MGTKLGHSALSLERNAREQFSMVARTGPCYPADLSSIPDRSRHGILSHLCVSVAAREEQRIPAARSTSNARTNRWPRTAFCSSRTTTRRKIARRISAKVKNTCALFWKKPAPRVWPEKIWASYPNMCGRICNLLVSRIQNSTVGNPRWDGHSRRYVRPSISRNLRNT